MHPTNLLRAVCAAILIGFAGQPVSALPAFSVAGEFQVNNDGNGPVSLGFFFTANASVAVVALGMYDFGQDGLLDTHDVGIFASSGGAPLVSATVPNGTAGDLVDDHRYVTLSTPFVLTLGETYLIAALTSGGAGSDGYQVIDSPVTVNPEIIMGTSRYSYVGGAGLTFPVEVAIPGRTHVTPNFQTGPVPEPGSAVLLLSGLGCAFCLRRRVG